MEVPGPGRTPSVVDELSSKDQRPSETVSQDSLGTQRSASLGGAKAPLPGLDYSPQLPKLELVALLPSSHTVCFLCQGR